MNLQDVISHFGSYRAVGDAVGLTSKAIYAWGSNGIPFPRQCQIEVITGGALKADRLPGAVDHRATHADSGEKSPEAA